MRQPYNNDDNPGQPKGKTGVIDQDEQGFDPSSTTKKNKFKASNNQRSSQPPSAIDEARQMLDEIAGLDHDYRATRPTRRDAARTTRNILLLPFTAIWAILKFIFIPIRHADFRLLSEMRKFLRNPGHFFWFNRIAPEAASQHFGTTSTDAMTHHARRYGAHTAMLVLAIVVVLFGGFSGLAAKMNDVYAYVPNASVAQNDSMLTEDSREIYASAVASDSKTFTRRIATVDAKEGDTLRSIAAAHNISLETLLYANNFVDPDTEVKPGQKLVVPPVTGMLHITGQDDTVGKIADIYGVDPKVILSYKPNNLDGVDTSTTLKPLQEVMVPGGSMPLRDKVYMYTVKPSDTLKGISEKFGLSVDTLLNNNDLDNGLQPGQQIRILPVDGVLYTVKKGETLAAIAQYLGTSVDNIVNFRPNNVARNVPLQTGQSLVVPGGDWPPPPPPPPPPPSATPVPVPTATPKPAANAPASQNAGKPAPAVAPPAKQAAPQKKAVAPAPQKAAPAPQKAAAPAPAAPNAGRATGSMMWPIRGVITTYFGEPIWYGIHMGLDISTSCGTPTVAADGGTVVQSGWNGGYGNSVLIDHGGGIQTRYGHFISSPPVRVGQRVAKGQVIGYEGSTGNSTGCHVHFEVLVGGRYTDPLKWLR
ncbi:MAG TPA: LysM peptidoglycan-binding domain-containing protein [Chloroflexia bacterium]|nr:LysM peptidoglycan-binding domain-containing protein [Chloroflexia bacterium]